MIKPRPRLNNNLVAAAAALGKKLGDLYYYGYPNKESNKPKPTQYLKTPKVHIPYWEKNKKGPKLDLKSKAGSILSTALRMRMRGRSGSRTRRGKKGKRLSRGYYLKKRRNAWMYKVRPEIKTVSDVSTSGESLALYNVNGSTSGHVLLNSSNTGRSFTPRIAQGTGTNQRIGETVLMKTLHCRFRFATQTSYVGPVKIKIYIFYKPTDTTVGNAMADFLDTDPLLLPVNSIYSPMSSRASHTYQQYRILREVDVWIPEDNTAGVQQIVIEKELSIPLYGKTLRMKPGTNDFEHGDIGACLLCSAGAYANPPQTGIQFTWATDLHYIDP